MPLLNQEKINNKASWALWNITEDESSLLNALNLSPKEKTELAIIKNLTRRLEWLASRFLIKQLAQSHQIEQAEVVKDLCGKPHLAGSTAHISLSHSYPYAAAIIHTEKKVGIDVEKSRDQLFRIRHKFLNSEELSSAGNNLHKLCVYWAAKEAIYKLNGKGGLILLENILIKPFSLKEKGTLEALLLTNQAKESFTLHYRRYMEVHICYSL